MTNPKPPRVLPFVKKPPKPPPRRPPGLQIQISVTRHADKPPR